jgi:cytochrome c peroxidase
MDLIFLPVRLSALHAHFIPLFNGLLPPHYIETEAEVLGLYQVGDTTKLDVDLGRYLSTPLEEFKRVFKTPTLRNIDMTAPYGHNGCFPDLESIMIFYNHGGGVGYGFELENQTLPDERLNLSAEEMHLIIRFMESLTDDLGYNE